MNHRIIIFLLFFIACSPPKKITVETETNHFPTMVEKPTSLPDRGKFYIFIFIGQSNMAGRGFVQPQDTISSGLVLALDKNNEWIYAKEPLHYYEPSRTGLDCGLSFGKKLAALYKEKITIGLVPCAVGGSSIEQWIGDSTYRDVTLYSNLINKARKAAAYGTIKGILWHQGEANANTGSYKNYKEKLELFFTKLRNDLGDSTLPIYAGQLGSFLDRKTNPFADSINNDLLKLSSSFKNFYVINLSDLTPNPDSIHFNSQSQRIMGERFAKLVYKTQ
jgi:hypothetical protein